MGHMETSAGGTQCHQGLPQLAVPTKTAQPPKLDPHMQT